MSSISLQAQKDPLKEGNKAFEEDHYREALIYYNQIDKIATSGPLLYKRGVCYYEINQLGRSLEDFRRAWEYGYKNPGIDYYTGLIQHHKGNFTLAASYYKKFLKETDQDDAIRPSVRQLIKQCGRAIDLSYKKPLGIIEKLPGGINTVYDEVGLLESPSTPGKYYYTSNKPNLSSTLSASDYDIYWVKKDEGEWSEPKRMSYVLNKSDNDILLGFTPASDGVYFYRGKDHQGDIFLNRGIGTKTRSKPVGIPSTMSLVNGDVYFYDENVMLFSSKEGQGYGGFDIYASIKEDGFWSSPINLGPEINSPSDELNPYISNDGSELYFSSDRDESIGGFDIFFSQFLYEADKWATPENLGIPVNSPGDDTHFHLSYDGLTAMLSSDRKNSFGSKDNYIVRFKDPRGIQDYGDEELAFLGYNIVDRKDVTVESLLEANLTDTTAIQSSDLASSEANTDIITEEKSIDTKSTEVVASKPTMDKPVEEISVSTPEESEEPESKEEIPVAETVIKEPEVVQPEVKEPQSVESEITTTEIMSSEVKETEIEAPKKVVPEKIKSQPETTQSEMPAEQNQSIPVEKKIASPENKSKSFNPNNTSGTILNLSYEPIYYSSGLDLINERNYDNVETIIKVMQDNPEVEVDFISHSDEEGILEYKLYSSLKMAERLEQHFMSKGISDDRVHIIGVADNYPIAKTEKDGGDIKFSSLYNSRIEVKFLNYDYAKSSLERVDPDIPSYSKDIKHALYSTLIEDAVVYKIQIAVVSQMYRSKALDLFNDTSVEEDEKTGLYNYTIGLYDSFTSAQSVKRDLDRMGFTDATVVAYFNGKRIGEDEYVYYVNDFPDLRGMMNVNK